MPQKEKPLKNYTTTITPETTIGEIEMILSLHGATDIYKQYDGVGNVVAISFAISTEHGRLPFRMPAQPEAVRQILIEQKKKRLIKLSKLQAEDINHARRVTWRIIKNWIDAQIALIELNQVKLEEVFLPYMISTRDGKTLFQYLEEHKFKGALPEHVESGK